MDRALKEIYFMKELQNLENVVKFKECYYDSFSQGKYLVFKMEILAENLNYRYLGRTEDGRGYSFVKELPYLEE